MFNNIDIKHKIKSNVFNYGIYCIGFIVLYILLTGIFEIVFDFSDVIGTMIANIIMLVFCIFLFCKRCYKQNVPSFQSFVKPKAKQYIFWYVYVALIAYSCLTLFHWIGLNFNDTTMESRADTMSDIPILFLLFYSVILAPIVEECMMRLFMYNQLKRSSNWIVSMLVTSFVFAMLHGTISHMILATIFAIALTLAYENTRCILIPIFGHLTYNAMSIFIPETSYNSQTGYIIVLSIVVVLSLIVTTIGLDFKMKTISYQDM